MASMQDKFVDSLSDDEGRMFVQIMRISQEARNHEWAKQNQIYRSAKGASAYVFHGNYHQPEEQAVMIDYPVQTELVFTADQNIFKLKPGEPARSAMTRDGFNEPIFINTQIINQPGLQLSFADTVQILVHEFGHKIGPQQKNQTAVDSLAAKIKTFVDAHSTVSRISKGSVQITKFSESIYEDWQETTLQGRYIGVNIPYELERFRAIADEGLYVFLDSENVTTEITSELISDLAKDAVFEPYKGLEYNWKHFRTFAVKSVSVREFAPGKIRIEVDGTQSQTAIPFLVENDIDPVEYRPWARVSQKSELGLHSYQRAEWTFDTNKGLKLSSWMKPLIFEDSQQAKFLKSQNLGSDLTYTFVVPQKMKEQGTGVTPVKAFLVCSLNGDVIELEGQRSPQNPDQVSFTFKNATQLMSGTLKPLNIEVEAQVRNLAKPYYVRTRLFIDRSEPSLLNGRPVSQNSALLPQVISQTIHDGKIFMTLSSATELLGMKLQLELKRTETVVSKTALGAESKTVGQGSRPLSNIVVPVTISSEGLQQDLKSGVLHVAIDLSKSSVMKDFRIDDLTPGDLPSPTRG
ncbi:MAG: hypothetical protein EOP05_12200, partial [Proteobacteria bacterium]